MLWEYVLTEELSVFIRSPFRNRKYVSTDLSLSPGVHATLTLPEQLAGSREVRETAKAGGRGGSGEIVFRN